MAFLVCYSEQLTDHTKERALYLDQGFYELVFSHCRTNQFNFMRRLAVLRYKSPTQMIACGHLGELLQELNIMEQNGLAHPQLAELRQACRVAKNRGVGLTISGDMHPELRSST